MQPDKINLCGVHGIVGSMKVSGNMILKSAILSMAWCHSQYGTRFSWNCTSIVNSVSFCNEKSCQTGFKTDNIFFTILKTILSKTEQVCGQLFENVWALIFCINSFVILEQVLRMFGYRMLFMSLDIEVYIPSLWTCYSQQGFSQR